MQMHTLDIGDQHFERMNPAHPEFFATINLSMLLECGATAMPPHWTREDTVLGYIFTGKRGDVEKLSTVRREVGLPLHACGGQRLQGLMVSEGRGNAEAMARHLQHYVGTVFHIVVSENNPNCFGFYGEV